MNTPLISFPDDCQSVENFLQMYWQKRPLLMQSAIELEDYQLMPDELAGLAMEPDVRARIIEEHPESLHWRCRHGPFEQDDFEQLPESHWTLLVQDIEKLLPEFVRLMQAFLLLPRWRLDDLMISYAVDGGSVGPHVDQYDVFLIQFYGKRHWQIQAEGVNTNEILPNNDMQILRHFNHEQEWVLNPGDILYLPPGVAHHGVAIGECMTCSVGFRSPSTAELALSLAEAMNDIENDQAPRFRDSPLAPVKHAGELDPETLKQLRSFLLDSFNNDELLDHAIARWLTEPAPLQPDLPDMTDQDLEIWLSQQDTVTIHPAIQMLYRQGPEILTWYIDGESVQVENQYAEPIKQLCDTYQSTGKTLSILCNNESLRDALDSLYQHGGILSAHHD